MKNFGFSLFDITNLESAIRISLFGLWVEKTRLKDGRSLLAIEVNKTSITVDALFMRFLFEG